MDARDLLEKLHYIGMERTARQLAIKDKLAPIEELAEMSDLEICGLILQNYQLVYAEKEEVALVHNDDAKEVFSKIKYLSR